MFLSGHRSVRKDSINPPSYLTGKARRNFINNRRKERQNEQYRRECPPFEVPSWSYVIHHAHRFVSIESMDIIINHCSSCFQYSMDTESDDIEYNLSLLQVHSIPERLPSIVLLINLKNLPSIESLLYYKFIELFRILFRSRNRIFSWGPIQRELDPLLGSIWMDKHIKASLIDLQGEFNSWFQYATETCEQCQSSGDLCYGDHYPWPYANTKSLWSLQNAIRYTSGLFIDKSDTRQRWNQIIDPEISTVTRSQLDRMIRYAVYDVLAVSYLHRPIMKHWKLVELQSVEISSLLCSMNDWNFTKDHSSHTLDEEIEEVIEVVVTSSDHRQDDQVIEDEVNSNDDNESMDLVYLNALDYDENQVVEQQQVHPSIDPVERTSKRSRSRSIEARKKRNHRRNYFRRHLRDQHLIVRQINPSFTLRKIKRLLNHLNVKHVHLRVDKSRRFLYIGVKRTELVAKYFNLIPGDLFIKKQNLQTNSI